MCAGCAHECPPFYLSGIERTLNFLCCCKPHQNMLAAVAHSKLKGRDASCQSIPHDFTFHCNFCACTAGKGRSLTVHLCSTVQLPKPTFLSPGISSNTTSKVVFSSSAGAAGAPGAAPGAAAIATGVAAAAEASTPKVVSISDTCV